jgi:hypothetical protein
VWLCRTPPVEDSSTSIVSVPGQRLPATGGGGGGYVLWALILMGAGIALALMGHREALPDDGLGPDGYPED